MESVHKKLERVRKPRVHITYEVYTGDAMLLKELPFVVGVLGDFSGDPTAELKPLGERKFIEINRDNFDAVMQRLTPGLQLEVENTLGDGGPNPMKVNLRFNSIADFEPARVVEQVEPLKELLDARNKLRDLMGKADRSDQLEALLEQVLQNTEALNRLSGELGLGPAKAAKEGDEK
ncbi:MAG: type VI secretion system contractile sheath small subunit [Pseudomonadota bacterium]|nr:type VI secretion system contractile sheath small subunit [Pseudomonadota bacterium]